MKKLYLKKSFLIFCIANIFTTTSKTNSINIEIESIHNLLKTNPQITYIHCSDIEPFEYTPFPISRFPEFQPHKGLFDETFIVKIPNGIVCSVASYIKYQNYIISEFIPTISTLTDQINGINRAPFKNVRQISGKVAVITALGDICYSHWIYNILGRLALLELYNIEYDWLYVAYDKPYMKESLALWGIDPTKIIQPFNNTECIQAEELIAPSFIGARIPESYQYPLTYVPMEKMCNYWNVDPNTTYLPYNKINPVIDIAPPTHIPAQNYFFYRNLLCGSYYIPWVIEYISKKLSSKVTPLNKFLSKKFFISRKDAKLRKTINEDEIFELFKPYGFERYILEQMPLAEQIALFQQAECIVAAHGTGLMNLIFCKPGTTVVEIYQGRSDCCFYYLAQIMNLKPYCIKTMEFNPADIWGYADTVMPVDIIQKFIDDNKMLFN